MRAERVGERVDRRAVSPLREVRDGLERPRHARSLGSVKAYYDRRAPEYADWWGGDGLCAERDRPGWEEEVGALCAAIASLEPARTLDVACGTGFLTQHLRGVIVGLDQSESMLEEARRQAPGTSFVRGEGPCLPFGAEAF